MARILIVEDEPSTLNVLSTLLKAEGYEVTAINQGDEAEKLIESEQFDLMLSDIRMTPVDGMELLKRVHAKQPNMAVIMLTGYGTVETAVESLKLGAFDYITKPFKVDELFITVQKALESSAARTSDPGSQTEEHYRFENIVAASEPMRKVCEMIERVAQTEVMVLISGEDGVGKSLVAKTMHVISKRRDAAFVRINCTEMTESILAQELCGRPANGNEAAQPGAFEQAQNGTLYIEGIHAMPLGIQDLLLNVLQEKQFTRSGANEKIPLNVRLVTSTNANLDALVDAEQMREDLYYRLSALPIEIKPLRERTDDILPLVFHALRQFIGEDKSLPKITPEACAILEQYRWPGNVRELENVIKRALAFTKDSLTKEALPPALLADLQNSGRRIARKTTEADAYRARALKTFLRDKEKSYLEQVLKNAGGDKEKAAKALKISTAALEKKMSMYGL